MTTPGSLPQRVYLLAWDPAKGRIPMGTSLGAMLRAAALADLFRSGHLTDDHGRAAVKGRRAAHDLFLDAVLEEIAESKPRKWQHWIGRRHTAAVSTVREQLSDGGWVRLEPRRILGFIPTTRVTVRNPRVRKELQSRIATALRNPVARTDAADAALVTVVAEGGLKLVLDGSTRRTHKQRLHDLAELTGPIGPALRKSIQAAAAAASAG
jgi:hypothetical protein